MKGPKRASLGADHVRRARAAAAGDGENFSDDVGKETTTVAEAAAFLGMAERTLYRRAAEFGGQKGPDGRLYFDATRLHAAQAGSLAKGRSDVGEGERDARVVAALERGAGIAAIVTGERVPIRVALALRAEWLRGLAADRQGIVFSCGCGATSNPHTARCDRCHARTQVLTDAQRALLAGETLPDGIAACTGCGQRHPIPDLDRLCVGCRARIAVIVESGRARVVLRTPKGPVTLHVLSLIEMGTIATAMMPLHERPASMAPVIVGPPEPAPTEPRKTVADEMRMMQAQLDEINDSAAKARAELEQGSNE